MPFITNDSFVEFIKGARIALVGPAASASAYEQGKLIDDYDYVARVKSFFVPEEKRKTHGSRIDFLYTDNEQTNDILPGDTVIVQNDKQIIQMHPDNIQKRVDILQNDVKVVISTCPRAEWFFHRFTGALNGMSNLTNVRVMPDEPYMQIRQETMRPNAGFSAIIDLASLPISELYITGIDFYRSLYRDSYLNSLWTKDTISNMINSPDGQTPDGNPDYHDPDKQFLYFKNKIWKKDGRIKTDPFMQMVLEDPRYENFETVAALMGSND